MLALRPLAAAGRPGMIFGFGRAAWAREYHGVARSAAGLMETRAGLRRGREVCR